MDTSVTRIRSSDRRVAWNGVLISKTVDEESHYSYSDWKKMGTRLKSCWIALDTGSTLSLY